MKYLLRLSALMVLCAFLCGCGSIGTGTPTSPAATGPVKEPDSLYSTLFDPETKVELELHMTDAELQKLQTDYETYSSRGSKSPIYRMGNLQISLTHQGKTTIHTIEQVGVRMKGNTSRTSFYSPEDGLYNLIHLKISFQETFDDPEYYGADALTWTDDAARQARKDRTFASLSKIDLKWNKNYDTTFLKETYAYQLYRSQSLPAPSTTVCHLTWAGANAGLYTLYEPIDKDFLEYWFPEEALGGDLYKLGWTNEGATFTSVTSMGVEDEDAGTFYTYDLKTNKKTSGHEALKNLISVLNRKKVTAEEFAEVVDVDSFVKYAAASYFAGSPDDLRNNYNNTYLYFRADNGKAVFIPYDCDRCFGVVKDWDPTGHGMRLDDPFTDLALGTNQSQRNPLFALAVQTGGFLVEQYRTALAQMAMAPMLDPVLFADRFALVQRLYAGTENPDERFRNASRLEMKFRLDDPVNYSFSQYITDKQATLSEALNRQDLPQAASACYIRADFTNWDVWEDHRMRFNEALGCYEFTLNRDEAMRFKIYRRQGDNWFGHEHLPEEAQENTQTDGHRNIHLAPGRYLIRFYEAEERVEILPQ